MSPAKARGKREEKKEKKEKRKKKQTTTKTTKTTTKTTTKDALRRRVRLALLAAGGCFIALALAGFLAGRRIAGPPGSGPYRRLIERWCRNYNVDPNLVSAVVEAESSGRARAVSSAGALGLMQLMPGTAGDCAKELGLEKPSREDLFAPELNVRLGVYYLAKQRKRFGEEREFVVAAYHAGPTRVDRWRRRRSDLPAAKVIEELAGSATRAYVRKVIGLWEELGQDRPSASRTPNLP